MKRPTSGEANRSGNVPPIAKWAELDADNLDKNRTLPICLSHDPPPVNPNPLHLVDNLDNLRRTTPYR